ncbi:MAG: hypothetical protein ACOYMA_16340 [Bacteroidia bacterium]
MKTIHVWFLLMLLTAITIITTVFFFSKSFIIGLFTAKFILVVFHFMEIKKAHNFWKIAVLSIVVIINFLIILV